MATRNENMLVSVAMDTTEARQNLDALKKQAIELRQLLNKAVADGDRKSENKLRQDLRQTNAEIRRCESSLMDVDRVMGRLSSASIKEMEGALKTLNQRIKTLDRDSEAFRRTSTQIRELRTALASTRTELGAQRGGWDRLTGFLNSSMVAITGITASISGLIQAGRSAVQKFLEIDESMAETRKFTGLTSDEVKELNEQFKGMDTRTSREQLNALAQEAGRLGKNTKEAVAGYVDAANIINVALDDLGEGATQEIAKITNIFGVEQQLGTREAMLATASAVNTLSQNCTASSSYLVEFAQRMAGIGSQAGLTVDQILAFGAVLDSNGQAVEMSSTALSQLLMKLSSKNREFAQMLGIDANKLNETLKHSAKDGLLMFLDGLKAIGEQSGYENATMTLAPAFKEMGLDGARTAQVLSTLAMHLDEVKEQLGTSASAFKEAKSATEEYNTFNTTATAEVEKAKKQFTELAVELGERLYPVLKYVHSGGSMLVRILLELVKFVTRFRTEIGFAAVALGVYLTIVKASIIQTKLAAGAQAAWNVATSIFSKISGPFKLALAALTNAVQFFTNGLRVSYEMQDRWSKGLAAMTKANWVGLIMTAVAAIAIYINKLREQKKAEEEAAEAKRKLAAETVDISQKVSEAAGEEITKLKAVYAAAVNEKKSKLERIKAANWLLKTYPAQFKSLTAEQIMLGKAKKAYDNLTISILKNARARAAADKIVENNKRIMELEMNITQAREERRKASEERDKKRRERDKWMQNGPPTLFQAWGIFLDSADFTTEAEDKRVIAATQTINSGYEEIKLRKRANARLAKEAVFAPENAAPEIHPSAYGPGSAGGGTVDFSGSGGGGSSSSSYAGEKRGDNKYEKTEIDLSGLDKKFDEALTMAQFKYGNGLASYRDFLGMVTDAEFDYFEKAKKIFEEKKKTDTDQYKAVEKEAQERITKAMGFEQEYDKKFDKRLLEAEKVAINNSVETPGSKYYQDEAAAKEEIHRLEMVFYRQQLDDMQAFSKEYLDIYTEMEQKELEYQQQKQAALLKKVEEWTDKYLYLSAAKRFSIEKKMLDEAHKRKLVSEEEYLKALRDLRKKYQDEVLPESAEPKPAPGSKAAKAALKEQEAADLAKVDSAASQKDADGNPLLSEKDAAAARDRVRKHYRALAQEAARSFGSEQTNMLLDLVNAWDNFFNATEETGGNWATRLASLSQAAFAVMNAGMQQYMEFSNACTEAEIAKTQEKYDKQLALVKGNSYETNRLERKRDKDIAKLKNDQSKKAYAMQVIQAIAQTATNALNAYGSALALPAPLGLTLAPIAAAMATAAGLVQIATLKKQQQAAASQGYAQGGFTPDGPRDKEVGVVHAGEWVASQKLLRSPATRPIIDALEYAQRNNRLPQISPAAGVAVRSREISQTIISTPESGSSALMERTEATLGRLADRLDEPIAAVVTVAGDYGINKKQNEYSRMIENKSPRYKRIYRYGNTD